MPSNWLRGGALKAATSLTSSRPSSSWSRLPHVLPERRCSHCSVLQASWRDEIPRIVDNIPRRVPHQLYDFSKYAYKQGLYWFFPATSALESSEGSAPPAPSGWPGWPAWILLTLVCASVYEIGRATARAVNSWQGKEETEEEQKRTEELRELTQGMRSEMRGEILQERSRGVRWLALVVLFSVFVAELFDNSTPLRP